MKDASLGMGGYAVRPRPSTLNAPPEDLLPHSAGALLQRFGADAPLRCSAGIHAPSPAKPEWTALVPPVRTLHPLPSVTPWEAVTTSTRSKAGLNAGVYFLGLPTGDLVAKLPEHPQREAAAAWTAHAVGLRVPETRLETRPTPNSSTHLPSSSSAQVLIMQRIPGHHFGELQVGDLRDLRLATPRARHLFEQLGRVLAYDYLIGNPDRFPAPGLCGTNTGNLMLCDDSVWCIDSTLPSPADVASEDWLTPFHRGQRLLFDLARTPTMDAGRMARVASFFSEVAPVSWQALGPGLLDGAATQCRAIARTRTTDYMHALEPLQNSPGGPPLAQFILDNLQRFREAFRD